MYKVMAFGKRFTPGFTLLEVMVSLSIIAIALLAVYGNYSQTIAMNTDQQFNTTRFSLFLRPST